VFVGEGKDPVAGVAVAGLHLPEQERDGAASSDCLAMAMPRPVLKRPNLGLVLSSTLEAGRPAFRPTLRTTRRRHR